MLVWSVVAFIIWLVNTVTSGPKLGVDPSVKVRPVALIVTVSVCP